MATTLRVVFDSNVFTPSKFDIIEQSYMRELCKRGRIVPVYGHILLEETFRAYGTENKRQELIQRWLPFITETVDRFCDDFIGIWHKELIQGQGLKTNIYMSRRNQEKLLSRLPSIPLDGSWRAWHSSKHERDIEEAKRAAQREISQEIRKSVGNWRKAVNFDPKRHGTIRFDHDFENGLDFSGRQFLIANVQCKNPQSVANRWSRNKAQYPYFTNFVVNMLYTIYYAMAMPNNKIDLNAQADLDLGNR